MSREDTLIWTKKNATMSDKSVREEYKLSDSDIVQGIEDGYLRYRRNNCHGNPYLKLVRSEIESFVVGVLSANRRNFSSIIL